MRSPHFYETLATIEQANPIAIQMLKNDVYSHPSDLHHSLHEMRNACAHVRQYLATNDTDKHRYSECIAQMKRSCTLAEEALADQGNGMGSDLRCSAIHACEAAPHLY